MLELSIGILVKEINKNTAHGGDLSPYHSVITPMITYWLYYYNYNIYY